MLVRRVKKDLKDFKSGAFIGRFQSDDTAGMAVKGLSLRRAVTASLATHLCTVMRAHALLC